RELIPCFFVLSLTDIFSIETCNQVVGSAATLMSNPPGKNIVESAEKKNPLFKVSKPMNYFLSEENLETMNVIEDMEIPDAAR
ncbi:unnamed protein product, partial [Brassica rapa subsp. trilocularis]